MVNITQITKNIEINMELTGAIIVFGVGVAIGMYISSQIDRRL
jgi:hypothetical protein